MNTALLIINLLIFIPLIIGIAITLSGYIIMLMSLLDREEEPNTLIPISCPLSSEYDD